MASEVFSIGNVVTWRSQAQGSAKTKVGTIIEVVPPDTRPSTEGRPGLNGCGFRTESCQLYRRGHDREAEAGQEALLACGEQIEACSRIVILGDSQGNARREAAQIPSRASNSIRNDLSGGCGTSA